jgi:predicted nucleic acid-binding protein
LGWIADLSGKTVALDTALLIYWIEESDRYLRLLEPFFQALEAGRFEVVTSTVTLLEVLVHPLAEGCADLARQYRDILLHAGHVRVAAVTPSIAERAASLRATTKLRTPDAIQLAVAHEQKAAFFLTNDSRLPQLPDIDLLVLDALMQSGSASGL